MARIGGLIAFALLALFAGSAHAHYGMHASQAEASSHCEQGRALYGGSCVHDAPNFRYGYYTGGVLQGLLSYPPPAPPPPECEAYDDPIEVTFFGATFGQPVCNTANSCVYQPDGPQVCSGGQEPACTGLYYQSGASCDPNAPGGTEPDPDNCDTSSSGIKTCLYDDKVCIQKPGRPMRCVSLNQPNCDAGDKDALCNQSTPPKDQPPEAQWEPEETTTVTTGSGGSGNTTNITSFTNNSSSETNDNDSDNDGTNDEDDEEEDENSTSLTGCDAQPACDTSTIECAHYITAWRHRCAVADNEVIGGESCSAKPQCTADDPIKCATLTALWRIRCDNDTKLTESSTCAREPSCVGVDVVGCAAHKEAWRLRCSIGGDVTNGTSEACDAPPTCKASPVLCAQLKQTWLQRCAVDAGNVGATGDCEAPPSCNADKVPGGKVACATMILQWQEGCDFLAQQTEIQGGEDCSSPPQCSNPDSPACDQVVQAWETRCGVEVVDVNITELKDDIREAFAANDGEGDPGEGWGNDDPDNVFDGLPEVPNWLNVDGFGFPRECPMPQALAITAMGTSFTLDSGKVCDLGGILGSLMVLLAGIRAARIVTGG